MTLDVNPCPYCRAIPSAYEDCHYIRGWHYSISCYNDDCLISPRVFKQEKNVGPNYVKVAIDDWNNLK